MARTPPSTTRRLIVLLSGLCLPAAAAGQPASVAWHPPDLVDAVGSIGTVVQDGRFYVYGSHVGRVHAHSIENISPGFRGVALQPDG